MDITKRLRTHLQETSDAIQPHGAGPRAAIARGTTYRRRRHIGAAVGAFVVVGVVGFATAVLLAGDAGPIANDDSPASVTTSAQGPTSTVASTSTTEPMTYQLVASLGDPTMHWTAEASPIGFTNALFESGGAFYALSTAPGDRSSSTYNTIYYSQDGSIWSHESLGAGLFISDLAEHDGTLYMVSTGPGVAQTESGAVSASVGTSTDLGATWSMVDLSLAATPPDDLRSVRGGNASAKIAASDAGVIAIVRSHFFVDYRSLVPAEYQAERFEVLPTETGVEVLDFTALIELEQACVTAGADPATPVAPNDPCAFIGGDLTPEEALVFRATWSELGISDLDPDTYSELFVAGDDGNFEAVVSPFDPEGMIEQLVAVDDGFVAKEWLFPRDARTDSARGKAELWWSADGRSWRALGAPSNVYYHSVGTLDGDLVIAGTTDTDIVVMRYSESRWEAVDLRPVMPTGTGVDEYWISAADVGPLGVVMALQGRPDQQGNDGDILVIYSADLTTWSVVPVADLADPLLYVRDVVVGQDQIIIQAQRAGTTLTMLQLTGTPLEP